MRQLTSWPEAGQLVEAVTRWNPNLDNITFEVCALYFLIEVQGVTILRTFLQNQEIFQKIRDFWETV